MVVVGSEPFIFDINYLFGDKLDYIVEEDRTRLLELIKEYRSNIFVCSESNSSIDKLIKESGYQHKIDYYLVSDLAMILDSVYPVQNGLLASEIFMKLYSAPHGKYLPCVKALYSAEIDKTGNVFACCSAWQKYSMGNVMKEGLYKSWNSFFAKVLRLSTLNGTLCFCETGKCANAIKTIDPIEYRKRNATAWPHELNVAIDDTCNLCCRFCRNQMIVLQKEEQETRIKILKAIKKDLKNISNLYIAGNGEVFLSKIYGSLLNDVPANCNLTLVTNGLLYESKVVQELSKRTRSVSVYVSIDAARSDTYEYLRRKGSFDLLCKKLELIKLERSLGIIKQLVFRFVVQRRNYLEMIDFIKFGKEYLADYVDFIRLVNSGTEYTEQFSECSLLDGKGELRSEYKDWFKQPIFRDKYVHIDPAFIEMQQEREGDWRVY